MANDYIIAWKSTSNARVGRGKNLMCQHEAEALAAQLNQEHPEFQHLAVHKDNHNFASLFPTPKRDPAFDTATVPSSIPLFPTIEPEPTREWDSPLAPALVAELKSEESPEPALAFPEHGNDADPLLTENLSDRDAA